MKIDRVLSWMFAVVSVLVFGPVQAQVQSDTLSIRFRMDGIRVDMGYADNAKAWESFTSNFKGRYSMMAPNALRLDIFSGASPEGTAAHNRWLGENRGIAIRRLVRQHLGNSVGSIIVHNEAARWDGLYMAVAASQEPWRDEVLHIIEQPASGNENQRDHREYQLRALQGGSVWPVLLERYLAPLRSGATAILSIQTVPGGRDTIVVRDTIVMAQPIYITTTAAPDTLIENPINPKVVSRWPVWILRSNIPLLGTGTPNLQAEFSLGHKDKWSLNVEGIWSWWTFSRNAYANEILYGSVELRRWLGRRYRHHTLSGWHLGLALGGGYGDLEWRSNGYQAEVYSAYVNLGWQGRFGRRKQWAFDAGIGLGFAHIDWRRYDGSTLFPVGKEERYDDHLMWQETGRTNWPGAVHANISIGYVFNQHDARWRRQRALERDAERNDYLHFRDSLKAREEYVRDSTKTAEKMRLKEIQLLPKAERKEALKQLAAEKEQAELDAKAAKRQAKIDAKEQKKQEKLDRQQYKECMKAEKAARAEQLKTEKAYAKTPEGKAAAKQKKLAEKAARQQAKADKKAAKLKAKADRRNEKLRKRIEYEHQRNLEKLQREMEKADEKYKTTQGV
ncbi:MAG: DUF3575 domain-containing protein [Prevotella sp.]|nr:DUF3575 domain-containing protein [Prevotella sp.]